VDLKQDESQNVRYYSRPLSLPGSAIGCISLFFDANQISEQKLKELGYLITSVVEDFFSH